MDDDAYAKAWDEAKVLNWFWDWARLRALQRGHPYYAVIAQEVKATVRSFGGNLYEHGGI